MYLSTTKEKKWIEVNLEDSVQIWDSKLILEKSKEKNSYKVQCKL